MGSCFSVATKVSGSTSSGSSHVSSTSSGAHRVPAPPPKPRERSEHPEEKPYEREKGHRKRPSGPLPCGKRTEFGYAKDFDARYSIGKLLGHGQFGYTFVATDNSNGERVAVKRIDKNKVGLFGLI